MQLSRASKHHRDGSVGTVGDGGACSFAELVYAHYDWRSSPNGRPAGGADQLYRQTLHRFEAAHGDIVSAYWCSHVESAVALTEKRRRFPLRPRIGFHRETDWATKHSPGIATELHRLDELAIRARTVLSGAREAICLHLVAACAAHLLSLADDAATPDNARVLGKALAGEKRRIDDVEQYYKEAANGQAQIVYFAGMASVALLVSALGGLVLLLHYRAYQTGIVALIAGALGAVVSVIQRITNSTFQVDYDVGRPYAFFLGGLRPLIGGALAIAITYTFDSGILHLPIASTTPYKEHLALVVVGFLAGFSERWAQDTLATALPRQQESDAAPPLPADQTHGKPSTAIREAPDVRA
jgi:hypothetical protein